MSRAVIVLAFADDKIKAKRWIDQAPVNTRVEFRGPKRSLPQNDRLWSMLTEVAEQKPYHGLRLSADDYKILFLDALKREVRMIPNLDGNGLVSLGRSSSDLSKEEMSDLIELISAWGATNGIVFKGDADAQA